MSRFPPSFRESITSPDHLRKVQEYLNDQTLREELAEAAGSSGALGAVAWLFSGQLFDEPIGVVATQVAHNLGRTPVALLWYEGQTVPTSWLIRSAGGTNVAWDHEFIWLTGQAAQNYKFILI